MYFKNNINMLKYFLYLTMSLVAVKSDDGLVVQITNGKIRGRKDSTVGLNKTYIAFQGIPFAQPPLGDLRFEPPVSPSNWSGILNTTEYKGDCVQGADGAAGGAIAGSEDCLYINVYKPDITDTNLTVMVWIYGGGFVFGTSSPQLYGPDYLLDNDVIVVTFNYRLNIFGFLSTGDLVAPGNSGLKDQALALEWVQGNIAQFGGDPNSVTLFGESAGAASIAYHLTSTYTTLPLFKNVILESGSSLCVSSLSRQLMGEAVNLVAKKLNLTANNSQELINALKQTDVEMLYLASNDATNTLQGFFRDGAVFAPVIEPVHSGAFVTQKSHQLLTEGHFRKVPVLLGINSMEALYFADGVIAYLNNSNATSDLVSIDLNLNNGTEITDLVYNKIKFFYFGTEEIFNYPDRAIQFASDDMLNRPMIETSRLLSKFVKTYFYEFGYVGNLNAPSSYPSIRGAGHFDEIYYIFRKDSNATTATDELVRARLTRMWTNFAKYSNPTPSPDDFLLQNITWYPINQTRNDLLYLNIDSKLELRSNPKNNYTQFWNEIYNAFGNSPFDTY